MHREIILPMVCILNFLEGHVAKALLKLRGSKNSMLLIHKMSERYLKMSQVQKKGEINLADYVDSEI